MNNNEEDREKGKEENRHVSNKRLKVENGVDRFSSLPTELIYTILSFLDMKEAVKTTVLSKKWTNLWASLPTLNIDADYWIGDDKRLDSNGFMSFVNKIMLVRDESNVQKFRLKCPNYFCVNHWVLSVVRRNVQELHFDDIVMPPSCFFSFSTTLKSLELNQVTLNDMGEGWCPVSLEKLAMDNCFHDNIDKLIISSPGLVYIKIKSESDCDRAGPNGCDMKICAPKLEVLECAGFLYRQYSLERLSSLVTACFATQHVCRHDIMQMTDRRLNCIMRGITHVKSLTLSLRDFQGCAELHRMLKVEPFPNLKYAKLMDWRTDRSILGMAMLFESFSCIETLILQRAKVNPADRILGEQPQLANFDITGDTSEPTKKDDWDKQLAHTSVFQKLKTVEVCNLIGNEDEFEFIKYLLKTATVLEDMKLTAKELPESFIKPLSDINTSTRVRLLVSPLLLRAF